MIETLSKAANKHRQKTWKLQFEDYTAILVRTKYDWNKWETNLIKENEINRAISIFADNMVLKWCSVGIQLYTCRRKNNLLTFARCRSFVSLMKWRVSVKATKNWPAAQSYRVWLCWYVDWIARFNDNNLRIRNYVRMTANVERNKNERINEMISQMSHGDIQRHRNRFLFLFLIYFTVETCNTVAQTKQIWHSPSIPPVFIVCLCYQYVKLCAVKYKKKFNMPPENVNNF